MFSLLDHNPDLPRQQEVCQVRFIVSTEVTAVFLERWLVPGHQRCIVPPASPSLQPVLREVDVT